MQFYQTTDFLSMLILVLVAKTPFNAIFHIKPHVVQNKHQQMN